jgi:hypothetical protein
MHLWQSDFPAPLHHQSGNHTDRWSHCGTLWFHNGRKWHSKHQSAHTSDGIKTIVRCNARRTNATAHFVTFDLPSTVCAIPVPMYTKHTTPEQALRRNTQQEPRVVTTSIDKPAGPPIVYCVLKQAPPSDRMLCRHIVQKAIAKHTLRRTLPQTQTPAQYVTDVINKVFDPDTGKSLKYWQLLHHPKYHKIWIHSLANEFGQLAQGVSDRIKGTITIHFV